MRPVLTPEQTEGFKQFGDNTYVESGGSFLHPERIVIGSDVSMHAPYQLYAGTGGDESIGITIGQGCQISFGLWMKASHHIQLGRNVWIGPHVHMSDERLTLDYQAELAPSSSEAWNDKEQLTIGEGSWIGANAIIRGRVSIGSGCVVKPNSVVLHDVPDYCVVSGNPAAITEIYMPESGSWVRVTSEPQATELLEERRSHPLLSICIPTFNRAPHLEHCLESIYSQIGNNELVEVIVSDNASTDATPDIIQRYASRYSNFRAARNDENVGADPNIFKVMQLGKGKFIKLQGDDDFYVDGTLHPLLHTLQRHRECGLFHIFVRNGNGLIYTGEGMKAYLETTSIFATFITSLIMRRKELEQIEEPARFVASSFNQVYLQYAILEQNPRYCIMNSSMFTYAGLTSDAHNFGKVIFNSYQSILQHFIGRGLTEEDFKREKQHTLFNYAIPQLQYILESHVPVDTSGFEDVFKQHYEEEPYYEEALASVTAILHSNR